MLHSGTLNNEINLLHERAQRIVYSDYKSSFNTILEKDSSFSIHHRNIQSLATEIYKYLHGLSPAIMGDIIKFNKPPAYNLRTRQELYSRNPKTVRYRTETISFLAPKIWAIVPQNIKNCTSLLSFKINIRTWKPDCPCRLCKWFFETCWFYLKCYQSSKKFTEHKDCYSLLFSSLSLTHHEPMSHGSLAVSVFLGAHVETS